MGYLEEKMGLLQPDSSPGLEKTPIHPTHRRLLGIHYVQCRVLLECMRPIRLSVHQSIP